MKTQWGKFQIPNVDSSNPGRDSFNNGLNHNEKITLTQVGWFPDQCRSPTDAGHWHDITNLSIRLIHTNATLASYDVTIVLNDVTGHEKEDEDEDEAPVVKSPKGKKVPANVAAAKAKIPEVTISPDAQPDLKKALEVCLTTT